MDSSTLWITELDLFLFEKVARVKEVTINKIAIPVVNLVRKFPAPLLPNMVWLLPPPSPEPIAAPFPACNNTVRIKLKAASTCNTVIIVSILDSTKNNSL